MGDVCVWGGGYVLAVINISESYFSDLGIKISVDKNIKTKTKCMVFQSGDHTPASLKLLLFIIKYIYYNNKVLIL